MNESATAGTYEFVVINSADETVTVAITANEVMLHDTFEIVFESE